MHFIRRHGSKLTKLTSLAVAVNAVQIACALYILGRALFEDSLNIPEQAEIVLLIVAAALVIWGAVVDIQDAFIMRKVDQQREMLEDAYQQLETLNQSMRKQRHDFKNHLQVVYSLTEMGAFEDAMDYIKRIYEDIRSLGCLLKTQVPAVNALLSAKSSDCAERGIQLDIDIQSAWEEMYIPGWELCRVIGNLVDNAIDALEEAASPCAPRICVTVSENVNCFFLKIENNGPEIPQEYRRDIFLPGFTTKSFGHGNGLSIVRELVEKYDGQLELESTPERTCFSCTFPRKKILAGTQL